MSIYLLVQIKHGGHVYHSHTHLLGNKHRLFTIPRRITTNNNKDIVVVDRTSDDTGRVVVVGWERGLRWTYTGHSKKRLPGSMTPTIILLSVVTWIPPVNKDDDTEKNGLLIHTLQIYQVSTT
jgi:hypothetical protein